jgi:ABC-type sugar transport system ATPase subunit
MSILRNIFAAREEKGLFGLLKMKQMRATTMTILNEHVKIAGITSPGLLVEELSGARRRPWRSPAPCVSSATSCCSTS